MSIGYGSWGAADIAAAIYAALGTSDAFVRISLADEAGNLRLAASQGPNVALGARRPSRRREAFATKNELTEALPGPGDRRLAIHPMVFQDEAVGVAEVVAPSTRVEERRDTIRALVRQSAALIRLTRDHAESEKTLREIRPLATLTTELMTATSASQAMAAAVDASWERAHVPVAILERSTGIWRLGAMRGLASAKRTELVRAVGSIPVRVDDRTVVSLATAAESVLRRPAAAFGADPVVLLTERRKGTSAGFLQRVVSLLSQAMREGLGDREGMGLAVAAHELKGSLVGARAALDHVLESGAQADNEELLWRTRKELEDLTQLVGSLLDWGAGRGFLRLEDVDLVEIVEDAISSCQLGTPDARVRLDAPGSVPIRGDAACLRTAITNLIRNALRYSPSDEHVAVTVNADDEHATITVRDRGPGLVPDELDVILNPFARGRVGRSAASGNGLGLFIARRAFEAHEGVLQIESSDPGASFSVTFPLRTTIRSGAHAADRSPSVLSA